MKIVFDHQIFTEQSYGGISRYFVRLAQGLSSLGEQVEVVAPLHRNRYLKDLPKSQVFGSELERFPPKTGRLIMWVNDQISKFKIQSLNPDLIHETYYSAEPVCTLAKGRVITVYDMIHEKFAAEFLRKDKTSHNKRISITRADHVICISHNTKKDLCELFNISEHKISVVHLGFEKFSENGKLNNGLTESYRERPFLLYVGSRGGYKNFARMLAAVASDASLKDTFDILAFGGGAFNSNELDLISKLRFRPQQVRQIKGDDSILGCLYEQASAFIYPSLYEGFGLPPLEAMAHHCPVVSSNSSSMPEVVGNAAAYFDPSDIEEQAQAICGVVFDETRRKELIVAGQQRLPLFSWARCALETQSVYQKVLLSKEAS